MMQSIETAHKCCALVQAATQLMCQLVNSILWDILDWMGGNLHVCFFLVRCECWRGGLFCCCCYTNDGNLGAKTNNVKYADRQNTAQTTKIKSNEGKLQYRCFKTLFFSYLTIWVADKMSRSNNSKNAINLSFNLESPYFRSDAPPCGQRSNNPFRCREFQIKQYLGCQKLNFDQGVTVGVICDPSPDFVKASLQSPGPMVNWKM